MAVKVVSLTEKVSSWTTPTCTSFILEPAENP